jgi:glycosyltransferase domain-containing protein
VKKNDLTIMLTLRGRHLHTLRWLWHANRIGFPYHVIIADGEVHPTIDRLLSNPATFPNLSFEYHRHCDLSFSDFYKKCTETIQKVKTKYVMMSDNDDFLIISGIQRSIEYLDNKPEYVCAGGRLAQFSIVPRLELPGKIMGKIINTKFGYRQVSHDISFTSVSARVMDEINQYQVIHYHIYRTQALRVILEEVEVHDFLDTTVHEFYIALRAVTLGKVRIDPSVVCYLRQTGTSMSATYFKDWVHHLLHSNLPQDFRAMASAIANEVQRIDGNNFDEFRESILDAFAVYLRHMLGHTMLRHRFPRLFRIKQKLLWLKKLPIIPKWYWQRRTKKTFWKELSNACAEPALLAAYQEEFGNIETTLQGDEFLSFIKTNAPDLQ